MPFERLDNLVTGLYGGDMRTGLYGGWWYDSGAKRLHLKVPAEYDQWEGLALDPTGKSIHAVMVAYGIRIRGDYVVTQGLTLQHFRKAVLLDGADHVVIRSNVMRGNRQGVAAYTSLSAADDRLSSFALIEGNDISCSPSFLHREWVLGHDVISTEGILLASGQNHVIRGNVIHDVENGIYAGAPWGDGGQSTLGNPRYSAGTVIADNELYRIGDDALEIDGPVYNQVVWGNDIHDVFVGISAAPASVGPVWMVRNTIYLTNRYFPDGSLDLTGKYGFPYGVWKYNVNATAGTGPSLLYHNSSVVELDPEAPLNSISSFSSVWGNTPGFVVRTRNNSWTVNPGRYVLNVDKVAIEDAGHPVEIDMDHDNLWADLSAQGVYIARITPGEKAESLEEFQQLYGMEANGRNVLPKFADPSKGDFRIPADSPLVDAGVHIPGINDDFAGNAPDIGAEEAHGDRPTFLDVPFDHWAHDYIETLFQGGYVAGCSAEPLLYCPEDTMTRAESAVFIGRGVRGAGYLPPQPTEQVFDDVPLWEWFAKWANGLWEDGYTAGCGADPLIYCPLQEHTRAEGTVFFLRMMHGADYVPPQPVGIFADVPVDYWGAKWVEAAYGAGLIPACATEPELLFCPGDPLDRALGAYMMVRAKGLEGP
jgi:hypothetical protein